MAKKPAKGEGDAEAEAVEGAPAARPKKKLPLKAIIIGVTALDALGAVARPAS